MNAEELNNLRKMVQQEIVEKLIELGLIPPKAPIEKAADETNC